MRMIYVQRKTASLDVDFLMEIGEHFCLALGHVEAPYNILSCKNSI